MMSVRNLIQRRPPGPPLFFLAVLLHVLLSVPAAAGNVPFRSPEFCFETKFSSPPEEQDENRVTKQKIRIRGRRFLARGAMQAELITAVKFRASYVPDSAIGTYFDSTMEASATAVNGMVSHIGNSKFQGLPSRTFDVAWRSNGIDWTSKNIVVLSNGYSWVITAIYKTGMGRPQALDILRSTRIDAACVQRGE